MSNNSSIKPIILTGASNFSKWHNYISTILNHHHLAHTIDTIYIHQLSEFITEEHANANDPLGYIFCRLDTDPPTSYMMHDHITAEASIMFPGNQLQNKAAIHIIASSLSHDISAESFIPHYLSAYQLLKRITQDYGTYNAEDHDTLLSDFYSLQMQPTEELEHYLIRAKNSWSIISDIDPSYVGCKGAKRVVNGLSSQFAQQIPQLLNQLTINPQMPAKLLMDTIRNTAKIINFKPIKSEMTFNTTTTTLPTDTTTTTTTDTIPTSTTTQSFNTTTTNSNPNSTIICQICNKKGHNASRCFRLPPHLRSNINNNNKSDRPCTICHRNNHTTNNCYSRNNNNNTNQNNFKTRHGNHPYGRYNNGYGRPQMNNFQPQPINAFIQNPNYPPLPPAPTFNYHTQSFQPQSFQPFQPYPLPIPPPPQQSLLLPPPSQNTQTQNPSNPQTYPNQSQNFY